MFFDNLTRAQHWAMPTAQSDQHGRRRKLRPALAVVPKRASEHDNPNVWNILPVTTLRTIDLEGRKNSDPLFFRFWAERRDFVEGKSAPEYVQ